MYYSKYLKYKNKYINKHMNLQGMNLTNAQKMVVAGVAGVAAAGIVAGHPSKVEKVNIQTIQNTDTIQNQESEQLQQEPKTLKQLEEEDILKEKEEKEQIAEAEKNHKLAETNFYIESKKSSNIRDIKEENLKFMESELKVIQKEIYQEIDKDLDNMASGINIEYKKSSGTRAKDPKKYNELRKNIELEKNYIKQINENHFNELQKLNKMISEMSKLRTKIMLASTSRKLVINNAKIINMEETIKQDRHSIFIEDLEFLKKNKERLEKEIKECSDKLLRY